MTPRATYLFIYASVIPDHLGFIEKKFHHLIEKTIDEQLTYTPNVRTRNRKPMIQPSPFGASWELRFGPNNRFRVLYDIDEIEMSVNILAIGEKEGNRMFYGGEEYKP